MLGELWPGSRKAWVQLLALPLAGHMMPGTSHNLSELQLQPTLSSPVEKLPDGSSFLGLAHTRPRRSP